MVCVHMCAGHGEVPADAVLCMDTVPRLSCDTEHIHTDDILGTDLRGGISKFSLPNHSRVFS